VLVSGTAEVEHLQVAAPAPAVASLRRLRDADEGGQAASLWQAVEQALAAAGPNTFEAPGVRTNSADWALQGKRMNRCLAISLSRFMSQMATSHYQ